MIEGLIAMHLERYQASGAELIMGTGQFVAPKTLEVQLNDGGTRRLAGDRLIPFCLFTDPLLARVGLNERDASRPGIEVRVATLPMSTVLRTRTIAETHGFMKVLVETQSDHILGFTMLGPEAGEVMAIVQTAMLAGMPSTGLRDAMLTHPTMAEGLGSPFTNVPPRAAGSRAHA
jgi:pyruvate/2-oxoglutarate dehydrogenase complex dihydrolipoamide dehydrogenase (E3) component